MKHLRWQALKLSKRKPSTIAREAYFLSFAELIRSQVNAT